MQSGLDEHEREQGRVVVFPWVPDTAMSLRLVQIAANVSAREAT